MFFFLNNPPTPPHPTAPFLGRIMKKYYVQKFFYTNSLCKAKMFSKRAEIVHVELYTIA